MRISACIVAIVLSITLMAEQDPIVKETHDLLQEYSSARKEWIKNAPKADLGYGFYATAFMEIIDET